MSIVLEALECARRSVGEATSWGKESLDLIESQVTLLAPEIDESL